MGLSGRLKPTSIKHPAFVCRGGSSEISSDDESYEEEYSSDTSETEEELQHPVAAQTLREANEEKTPAHQLDESESSLDGTEDDDDDESLPTNLEPHIFHTSDVLQNLVARSAVVNPESLRLRELIAQRSNAYLEDLMAKRREQQVAAVNNQRPPKLPHPKKVLHYLAPKIPAIKHSPDVNLRIVTARSDIDSGVAACLLGTLGRVCEVYDREVMLQNRQLESNDQQQQQNGKASVSSVSAATQLVKDRRFEQVVECLLCGVDVRKRKRENKTHFSDAKKKKDDDGGVSENIEEIIEGEQVNVQEGLNIRDACRAAWGLAILGAHNRETLGGTAVVDLLMTLSLRIRDLLLSRLQKFLMGDLMDDLIVRNSADANWKPPSPEQRVDELAEELAEDSAAAMWAFACVRACTGMRSAALFETCCSILCQDPVDMRKRAQANNADASANDVVDRLAHSEAEILEDEEKEGSKANTTISETEKSTGKTTTVSDNKDALIDWLSPNELTDVLWALALHGSSEGSVQEETVISENAGTLKEIAFDRLMVFLRKDCALVELRNEQRRQAEIRMQADVDLQRSTEEVITKEGETVTVEVVDAAALLASERAALVAAAENNIQTTEESRPKIMANDIETSVAYEAIVGQSTSDLVPKESTTIEQEMHSSGEAEDPANGQNVDPVEIGGSSLGDTISPAITERFFFSPHDLCSLAWAVTELRDSLRFQIVDLVINIFIGLGEESFDDLGGADLSNLAWACARHTNDARPWSSEKENPACLQLAIWVVRRALIASGGHNGGVDQAQSIHILDPFQPPELSRLMWAVASLVGTFADRNDHFPEVEELAINALVSAGSNLSMFSPEDLVRIFWAFLEVGDMDDALSQPGVADALGRVFATIETTIVRWERGHLNQKVDEETEETRGGFDRLTSLFLRPSLSQKMLDELIEEYNELEEEEGKTVSLMAGDGKKQKLPRLRDLGIDPATLTKAAGGFARLAISHSNMRGSPLLTRVTLKLLTSKNGRLLQEFSMCNLIRACEAAAINESVGRGEDLVVGQFARRFLQLLNEANDPAAATESRAASDLKLASASPEEIATLLWSLGGLGARHFVSDDDRQSAYRKLRLVVETPLLTDDQIQCFSTSSSLQALRGLVNLNAMRSDKVTLLKVLQLIEPKLPSIRNERDLCEVAESLAVVRKVLANEDCSLLPQEASNNVFKAAKLDANVTAANDTKTTDENETKHDNATRTVSDFELLQQTSIRMLSTVARLAADRVSTLRAGSLCRLLLVYSLLPFQADGFINACEDEVTKRQLLLAEASSVGKCRRSLAPGCTPGRGSKYDNSREEWR